MTRHIVKPFTSADDAWQALEEQQGMSDGEAVDLWQHQLQTAAGLYQQGADDELIVAGLLHDLGDGRVRDAEHSQWAASLVLPLLGERVSWLIGAHADAKRYLCTTDTAYWASLSPLSQGTLLNQGGLMTPEELTAFDTHPYAQDAVRLRQCDDNGKNPNNPVANPEFYRTILNRVAAIHATETSQENV